jgi:hypothetical protein
MPYWKLFQIKRVDRNETYVHVICYPYGPKISHLVMRRHIKKFHNEINNNNKHSSSSHTKGCGGKTH